MYSFTVTKPPLRSWGSSHCITIVLALSGLADKLRAVEPGSENVMDTLIQLTKLISVQDPFSM